MSKVLIKNWRGPNLWPLNPKASITTQNAYRVQKYFMIGGLRYALLDVLCFCVCCC